MAGDLGDDPLLDVRPDRGATRLTRRRAGEVAGGGADRPEVGHRHHHVQLPPLVDRRRHHLDRASAGEEPGHLLDRTDGRRQPDPLRGGRQQRVEPLQAEGQVCAPLGAGHRVHLVEDHRLDAAQRVPGGRGEQQEQRLGSRDEDVGGVPGEGAPLVGRGVAGAHRHPHLRSRQAEADGRVADPDQRAAEVALHVHGEGLQRRDVEHPAAAGPRRGEGEPVERPQEGRQGLARTRGCDHQCVPGRRDGLPRPRLRRRGRVEVAPEPLPGGR